MSVYIDAKFINLISSRLQQFKKKRDYLWNFRCPVCGDSKKSKTKARGYIYRKQNDLFYNCKNCGASMSMGNFIKYVDPSLHKEYTMERYKSGESNRTDFTKPKVIIKPPKFGKIEKVRYDNAQYLNDLPDNSGIMRYVKARKIPKEFYNKLLYTTKYKTFLEETDLCDQESLKEIDDDDRLVIPFYDQYNQIVAFSGRALSKSARKLRYVTVKTKHCGNSMVYGLDRIDISGDVRIVEGPIDSLFLSNCIASADANLLTTALVINPGKRVLIFDNEPRNKELVKLMEKAINANERVVIWPNKYPQKDINQFIVSGYTSDEVEYIISSNTFQGLAALVNFNQWKKC